jgi:ligand-binding sensor domain-containing protein
MMRIFLLKSFLIILLPYCSFSQEYSYTHYDITEGLAGSTVYCITQDKDGFIWTGTETGVSRFDGTHFRNFTTKDGLPDVEILEMFGDSRGRVWMAPFRRSVCYYFRGKIYNQDNDPLLRMIHFKRIVENFAEDAAGNILISESSALHLVTRDGQIREWDSIHGRSINGCHAISRSLDGHFLVKLRDSVFVFNAGNFVPLFETPYYLEMVSPNFTCLSQDLAVWRTGKEQGCMRSLITGETRFFPFNYYHFRHVSYNIIADSIVCSNESVGSTQYTLNTNEGHTFLPGIEVSRTFRDDDGNIWFTTMGHGLYRLNSDQFRNFRLGEPTYDNCSVLVIKRVSNELVVGSNRNSVFRFHLPKMNGPEVERFSDLERKRIVFLDTLPDGRMIFGSDFSLEIYSRTSRQPLNIPLTTKSACFKDPGHLLFASSVGAFVVDLKKFRIVDTLWRERTTTIFYKNDTTYIGTLNGLYMMAGKGPPVFFGKDIPFLRKRIATIVESREGVLWIAPYDDAGIIGIKNGRVVARIGQQQGLTSDICRTLTLQGDYLWVGTDKGLNRIDLRTPDYPVVQYTANDGLGSNVINTVFVDSSMVYVGTPAGLSYFDESKVNHGSGCRLTWLDITSAGKSRIADSSRLRLPYQENNIRFDYAGIDYRSAGNITYQYRLKGLDTAWRSTKETFLDYPTLPAGNYVCEIVAINKFHVRSSPLLLHFIVAAPFWETRWFDGVVLVLMILLTWLLVSLRIKRLRLRQHEEKQLARKMSELEHMALRAQMNPHFIFNCLNSIQHYIFEQDILAANKYISGFSRLIRATLQNSSRSFIPLAEEIGYLSTYLSLEKLRFKEKMNYSIDCAANIDPNGIMIPPMLIQPYVENSMRHGLRHKIEGNGFIRIDISLSSDELFVMIEDNGIGRERAARFKTPEHIEYQSKGISLTADRIGLMNSIYGEGIGVEIIDLRDEGGQPVGTRVLIKFPLFAKPIKETPYDPNRTY